MNTKTLFTSLLLVASSAIARTEAYQKELNDALWRRGAKAKVIYHVVDDKGLPVEGATCLSWFWFKNVKDSIKDEQFTDKDGSVNAEEKSTSNVNYTIMKDDYYESEGRYKFYRSDDICVKDGKWIPYGKEIDVTLKPMKNPIPMYIGGSLLDLDFPVQGKSIGFDMMIQDWTSPYGKGEIADFMITFTRIAKEDGAWHERTYTLSMQFPHLLDGAYQLEQDLFSDFRSTYHADLNAQYQKKFDFIYDKISNPKVIHTIDEEEYMILRTRTKIDDRGNLVEAYYSKIYGPIEFLATLRVGGYSMNPTPNDTNLESDTKQNLLLEQRGRIRP